MTKLMKEYFAHEVCYNKCSEERPKSLIAPEAKVVELHFKKYLENMAQKFNAEYQQLNDAYISEKWAEAGQAHREESEREEWEARPYKSGLYH